MLEALDAAAVRRWATGCVQTLDEQRDSINDINVYPVPDGDTGSNMVSTMRSALEALLRAPAESRSSAGDALTVLAKGALTGSRGNSGVILSQVLRGFAEPLRGRSTVDADGLAAALDRGAELASAALANPVQGTMLSVAQAAGSAAVSAASGGHHDDLFAVAMAASVAGAEALARTPRQLAVLAEAGVVDAGGQGLLLVLDALVAVVCDGEDLLVPRVRLAGARSHQVAPPPRQTPDAESLLTAREAGSDDFAYEVMYLLDGADEPGALRLRERLTGLGDCVSVAGDGDGLWTVHVHCNDIGAAVEAGVEAGRPHRITVARFADEPRVEAPRFTTDRALIVVTRGAGVAELVRAEGSDAFEVTGPDASAYELLAALTATGAAHVTVLPAELDLIEAADEAAIRAVAGGQDVVVVPCASPVQALAALAVHDPRRRAGDDVVSMAEAAAATRRGELTVAEHDAITWIGPCRAGDVLGFADGEVVLIETGPADPAAIVRATCGVVDRMLNAGGELVTLLLGAHAPDGLGDEVEDHLRGEHPEVDLATFAGAQTGTVVVIGVE